jgi:predicted phage tail protein
VLHGYLKDLYSEEIYIEGNDPAEVINGFCKQTKAFDVKPDEENHQIRVLGFETKESLFSPFPEGTKELHLTPDLRGGKSGGFFKIVIGAVLIAAAFLTAGTSLAATTLFGSTTIGSAMFSLGVSLVLGGLLELLSPAPQIDSLPSTQDPEASKYLASDQNTVKIGTRIPLLYGRHIAHGHYLSFNIDSKDVSVS